VEQRKEKIREFLSRFLRHHQLGDDEDIFSLGFVNSLFAMQLVTFIEKEFEVTIESEDLELDNFRSVNSMDALVGRKLSAGAGV